MVIPRDEASNYYQYECSIEPLMILIGIIWNGFSPSNSNPILLILFLLLLRFVTNHIPIGLFSNQLRVVKFKVGLYPWSQASFFQNSNKKTRTHDFGQAHISHISQPLRNSITFVDARNVGCDFSIEIYVNDPANILSHNPMESASVSLKNTHILNNASFERYRSLSLSLSLTLKPSLIISITK